MTRYRKARTKPESGSGKWSLHDAKARLSEVVRKAKSDGPQLITIHGREEVLVISVEEYRRTKGQPTGLELVKVMQESPLRNIKIERTRMPIHARDFEL
jgi:prevent-host-death family protein